MEQLNEVVEKKELTVRSFSLKELADNYVEIKRQVDASGSAISDELDNMHEIAKSLLANRLDDVWLMKQQLESHNEALRSQLEFNNKMIEDIDYFTGVVVGSTDDKKIQGLSVSARMQKNGKGSVNILDESKVGDEYKTYSVSITDKFPATDKGKLIYYQSLILERMVNESEKMTAEESAKLDKHISKSVSKSILESDLKEGKKIDGAEYVVGHHLRWQVGKVKAVKTKDKPEAING